jgi:hypothetical protein
MVCSTISRSGWSIVRRALLAKGGTLKKRPSLHLHKVPTQSNKVSSQTLQMAPICVFHTGVQSSAFVSLVSYFHIKKYEDISTWEI